MTSNADLPVIPTKRYFSLQEVCQLANVKPEQLAEWQRQEGRVLGKGGNHFTRLDVIKIRQLHHGISDNTPNTGLDENGNPVISVNEMRDELKKMLGNIEKMLAN
ncbi:hypothetical protein [Alysiella crassa]|uniref:HTH merR-type domain-containing protein n=1 Tax=Alysiella crassa TaxID=153491 RepID=A0A376BT92_9NEIS|nr:hypothetical protein [Alysiella crassa]UOP07944.1 hypothetical protein LVJ80_06395 [Alysiella crassa]SSY80005.1 Uncharacterised protein [Alysiella crassa]